jgi:hypothetical protein
MTFNFQIVERFLISQQKTHERIVKFNNIYMLRPT